MKANRKFAFKWIFETIFLLDKRHSLNNPFEYGLVELTGSYDLSAILYVLFIYEMFRSYSIIDFYHPKVLNRIVRQIIAL